MDRKFFLALCLLLTNSAWPQDLLSERIRKITDKKSSVYFDHGVFHNGPQKNRSQLKSVRHSFQTKEGTERIVFDFGSDKVPKVYGQFTSGKKTIYLDLFDTSLLQGAPSFGRSKFVDGINYFPIDKDSLSVELHLRSNVVIDVFSLEKPGRLVFDLRSQ